MDKVSNDDCVKRFPTLITGEFSYNGNTISLQQRLITTDEKESYEIKKDDVLLDPDIFDANYTVGAVARETAKKTEEKRQRLLSANSDKKLNDEEIELKLKEFEATCFHTKEDSHKIRVQTQRTRKLNRENDLDLVVSSVSNDPFYGGYFKLNDEDVEIDKIKPILKRLLPVKIDELLSNAIRLTYATPEMVAEVKQ